MRDEILFEGGHRWVVFGRDPDRRNQIIDTNQYLVVAGQRALLLDPGGIELFAPMLVAVSRHVTLDAVTDLFASHQDPDIISSLGLVPSNPMATFASSTNRKYRAAGGWPLGMGTISPPTLSLPKSLL